jgi:hypothetical protein
MFCRQFQLNSHLKWISESCKHCISFSFSACCTIAFGPCFINLVTSSIFIELLYSFDNPPLWALFMVCIAMIIWKQTSQDLFCDCWDCWGTHFSF